jgi:hypothetical protein
MWLQPVDTPKTGHKNRCHLDLDADDKAAEVERLIRLGAIRANVGQTGHEGFIVMADPEGNEFCVLGRASSASDGVPGAGTDGRHDPHGCATLEASWQAN